MNQKITNDSFALCQRVDLLLQKAITDPDTFYEYASENGEVIKYAFLARAFVRELIDPLPELFSAIAEIEEEFANFANQIIGEDIVDEDEDLSDDEEEEE